MIRHSDGCFGRAFSLKGQVNGCLFMAFLVGCYALLPFPGLYVIRGLHLTLTVARIGWIAIAILSLGVISLIEWRAFKRGETMVDRGVIGLMIEAFLLALWVLALETLGLLVGFPD